MSAKGRINARAVIVTASTNVLTSGKIKFTPDLPKRQLDACDRLSLGSYDRIILELPGNPLGLQRDDLMFEKARHERTAALLANVGGSTLAFVDVGGKFGRDLAARGEGAMTAFATEWLSGLFGTDIGKAVGKTHATQWNDLALGARRILGGGRRRAAVAAHSDGADCANACSSRAKPCTKPCGARSAAPGNRASARPRRRCGFSASARSRSPRRQPNAAAKAAARPQRAAPRERDAMTAANRRR